MTTHFVCEICKWEETAVDLEWYLPLHEKTFIHQRAMLGRTVEQFTNAFCKQFGDILDRWVKK